MKRAAEKEKPESQESKRFRFAEGYEDTILPLEKEAQSYLISVKEHFKDDRGKYAEFVQIMNDFRLEICGTIGVITRLKQLFKSHKLLLSFNKFLPKGFEILFPSKEFLRKEHKVQYDEALTYIKKITTRFQNEEYIREGFFEIIKAYMKGNKTTNNIYTEVKLLFCDHQDLVDEFTYFLPASTSSALVPNLYDSATPLSEPALVSTSVKDSQKEDLGKVCKQGQKYFTLNNCHQSSQFSLKKDVEGTSGALVNEHSKKGEKEKELKEDWQWKEENRTEKRAAQNMESELYVMDQHSHRRNLTISSHDIFVRQRQMSPTNDSTGKHSQQGPPTISSDDLFVRQRQMSLANDSTGKHSQQGPLTISSHNLFVRQRQMSPTDDSTGKHSQQGPPTISSDDLFVRQRQMSPTDDSTGKHSQQGPPTISSDDLFVRQRQMSPTDDSTGKNIQQGPPTISSDDLFVRQRQMSPTDDSTGKHSHQGPPTNPSKSLSGNNPEQLDFFEKVKTNIGNVAYREIVKCINMYNAKVIKSEHLQRLAVCILGKHPEIVDEFNHIISQSTTGKADFNLGEEECIKHDKTGKGKEKERNFDGVLVKQNESTKETECEGNRENKRKEIKGREEDRDRHKDQHHKSRVLEKENERIEEKNSEEDRDGHKDQDHKSRATLDSNASPVPNNEEITYKPISEMDLSHWEQCTPSYRLLPQNFVKPTASYSTGLAAEVLNDICVSIASGTENYQKQIRVNPYAVAIFNCEDDRFELDMLIKNAESAIKRINEILEKKHDDITQRSAHFRIEDHLTAMNLRCIELIYGDCGFHIIDLLREKPDRCLPVIVKRLQQKYDEWVNCRTTFNKGWAEVYAKNYQRSLDHHSYCFKQRDKKSLSRKK